MHVSMSGYTECVHVRYSKQLSIFVRSQDVLRFQQVCVWVRSVYTHLCQRLLEAELSWDLTSESVAVPYRPATGGMLHTAATIQDQRGEL